MSLKKNAIVQQIFPYLSSFLNPFFATHPGWEVIFYSAIGLYGVYLAYNQDKVNELVKFIDEHPDEFRKDIIESKEFREGFLIFTEQYLKQRVEKKKETLKKIILGFTKSIDKKRFELERLNDALLRISVEALEFLKFFNEIIYPEIDKTVKEELKNDSYQKSDRSIEWWYDYMIKSKPIWEPINKWIYENFNQNSRKVKEQYNMLHSGYPSDLLRRIDSLEKSKRDEILESVTELVSLGILRIRVTGGSIGSGAGSDYNFTSFGRKFLTFFNKE